MGFPDASTLRFRPATDDELGRMKALLREAIDAGAIGLATSESPNQIG